MPQEITNERATLLHQESLTVEWLSNLNLVEFIRLEIPKYLDMYDMEELAEHKAEHFADICNNPECFELNMLTETLISMMPEHYKEFHCIREDVCTHLMRYCPAALAPL